MQHDSACSAHDDAEAMRVDNGVHIPSGHLVPLQDQVQGCCVGARTRQCQQKRGDTGVKKKRGYTPVSPLFC
jgi:hypothetical protein